MHTRYELLEKVYDEQHEIAVRCDIDASFMKQRLLLPMIPNEEKVLREDLQRTEAKKKQVLSILKVIGQKLQEEIKKEKVEKVKEEPEQKEGEN